MGESCGKGIYESERWQMSMETLRHALKYGHAQEIMNTRCPSCGKGVRVWYVSGRKAVLRGVCLSCLSGIWITGVDKEPPWVSELGNSFETG